MLFNSFQFLLVFLPASLLVDRAVSRWWPHRRLAVLALMSLAFYGYWDWRLLPLLLGSIGLNWLLSLVFASWRRPALIACAIVANLLVLGFFKYTAFFVDISNLVTGTGWLTPDITLPLGISFFTFHHLMYLSDLRAGRAPVFDLTRYALYIAFFPQVLAGPLVRWSEIMHQFDTARDHRQPPATDDQIATGIVLLVTGLVKKVLIADPLTAIVDPVFLAAKLDQMVTGADAWRATLGFTFKIYFDFSGYTDMALGIALLFGIVLPPNFNAPYRSTSLQDFWRRWHMTLSRFLRDYLYIPLGGSRGGAWRQTAALFTTMALGGLWHGAGWTFIAWGGVHGLGLIIVHLWRRNGLACPLPVAFLLTFFFVMASWVLFRAETFDAATVIYRAMVGFAPLGTFKLTNTLILAAFVCFLAPTSATIAANLPRWPVAAGAAALTFVLLLLKIGDSETYQFIYFRF